MSINRSRAAEVTEAGTSLRVETIVDGSLQNINSNNNLGPLNSNGEGQQEEPWDPAEKATSKMPMQSESQSNTILFVGGTRNAQSNQVLIGETERMKLMLKNSPSHQIL